MANQIPSPDIGPLHWHKSSEPPMLPGHALRSHRYRYGDVGQTGCQQSLCHL